MNINKFIFCKYFTKRFISIVGLRALNDYHFYWDTEEKEFLFIGLNDGDINEIEYLNKLPDHVLKALTCIDLNNTLNLELAKKLKSTAFEMQTTLSEKG